jgi:LacI family transcriptional regulator
MITMKEIAEKAGVSRTTVSFVLSGRCKQDQRISESTQKKILETARKLGYVRNDLVLSMVKGRSHAIGIVSAFKDFMFPIIRGYAQGAQNHGYSIRLFQIDGDDIEAALTRAVRARVDAIVCLGVSAAIARKVPEHFFSMGIPVSGLGRNAHPHHPAFDQQGSAAAMTEYLVKCGYKKIICCGGNYTQMPMREAGYREVMAKHQLEALFFNHHDITYDELIDLKPDAFFCGDDYIACALLQAAYKRNIRVPEVFGVAGFGNTSAGQNTSPALTTVDESYFESGLHAVQNIIASLKHENIPETLPLQGKLIIRDSTLNIKP